MTIAQKTFSLLLLGGLTLGSIPVAAAEGIVSDEDRQAIRSALLECRQKETREEKRECVRSVRDQYSDIAPNLGRRLRRHRGALKNISEEARDALKECRQNETREDKKECAESVAEKYGFELPTKKGLRKHRMHHRIGRLSDEQKEELRSCREHDTREEKRACMKEIFETIRN